MSDLSNDAPATPAEKIENSLKDIYCVSGLGADERVFQKLKLEGYQPIHIRWVEPENKESITDYAKRLTEQIKSDEPILIGLSFGGIIAIEIAKQINTKKVILISSTKNQQEVPFLLSDISLVAHSSPNTCQNNAVVWSIVSSLVF